MYIFAFMIKAPKYLGNIVSLGYCKHLFIRLLIEDRSENSEKLVTFA